MANTGHFRPHEGQNSLLKKLSPNGDYWSLFLWWLTSLGQWELLAVLRQCCRTWEAMGNALPTARAYRPVLPFLSQDSSFPSNMEWIIWFWEDMRGHEQRFAHHQVLSLFSPPFCLSLSRFSFFFFTKTKTQEVLRTMCWCIHAGPNLLFFLTLFKRPLTHPPHFWQLYCILFERTVKKSA